MRTVHLVINPASGGRSGRHLLDALRRHAGGERVSLMNDLDSAARRAVDDGDSALIACGGDGTAAAALEALRRAAGGDTTVPMGIIPLGTGNDLARVMGCPLASPAGSVLRTTLADLARAPVRRIDRWEWSTIDPPGRKAESPTYFYNYCSIGADARIALRFHRMRQRHPRWFRQPALNKAIYALLGIGEMGRDRGTGIIFDPPLPWWTSALVFTSIPSYAGGSRLTPVIRDDDGRLEAIALPTLPWFAMPLVGIRRARVLRGGDDFTLRLTRPVAAQIDGEPRMAARGIYRIRRAGTGLVLAHGAEIRSGQTLPTSTPTRSQS